MSATDDPAADAQPSAFDDLVAVDVARQSAVLRFFVVYAAVFVLGQFSSNSTWQPWFAIAGGVFLALVSYGYLVWDDAAMSRKLASGDFSPDDLVP